MPIVGQDQFGNVIRQAIERRAAQMRSVRGGEWGRIPQERSATQKSLETRRRGVERWSETRNRMQGG
jgi:hypothetical protein